MPTIPVSIQSELVGDRVRVYRRGNKWYANYQLDGRQFRKSLKTTSQKQAKEEARRLDRDLSLGVHKADTKPALLTTCVEAFLTHRKVEGRTPETLKKYKRDCDRFLQLASERGIKRVSQLDLAFVDAWKKRRTDAGTDPVTISHDLVTLRGLVNFALTREMVSTDPLRLMKNRRPQGKPQPCWTRFEVEAIVKASPKLLRPVFRLLSDTGMRFGEMAWLQWEDVRYEENELLIRPKPGWKPKSGNQRRVPMTHQVRSMLRRLPRTSVWVFPMPASRVCQKEDRRWRNKRLLKALRRVLKPLKLEGRLHTFRHSFISYALQAGMPAALVKDRVGHASDRMLAKYTHIDRKSAQKWTERIFPRSADHLESRAG